MKQKDKPSEKKPRRVFVEVDPEVHRIFKVEAAKRGVTMAALAEQAVRAYLAKKPTEAA